MRHADEALRCCLVVAMAGLVVALSHAPSVGGEEAVAQNTLSPKDEIALRTMVFEHQMGHGTRIDASGFPARYINVPDELDKFLEKDPRGTLELLKSIAHGGRPRDAATAVIFAIVGGRSRLGWQGWTVGPEMVDERRDPLQITWREWGVAKVQQRINELANTSAEERPAQREGTMQASAK
jgi:hypothetical protein